MQGASSRKLAGGCRRFSVYSLTNAAIRWTFQFRNPSEKFTGNHREVKPPSSHILSPMRSPKRALVEPWFSSGARIGSRVTKAKISSYKKMTCINCLNVSNQPAQLFVGLIHNFSSRFRYLSWLGRYNWAFLVKQEQLNGIPSKQS